MTSRSWIWRTLALIAVGLCVNVAVAFVIDPYGVLRDPKGRHLDIYFSERKTKLLLNKRYVPENLNGLVIGPSQSRNWEIHGVTGVNFYNESILGANASEEALIVHDAATSGNFKLVVAVLTPTMTRLHDLNGGLGSESIASAFGSIDLFGDEAAGLLAKLHIKDLETNSDNGSGVFPGSGKAFDMKMPNQNIFNLDPISMKNYKNVLEDLKKRGTTIVYVVPPLYQECPFPTEVAKRYISSLQQQLPPGPVVDMNGPGFEKLVADPGNFRDCVHLEAAGARNFSDTLAVRLNEILDRH